MELGATMEYVAGEVSQQGGIRCLYIVGGTIQPLPPHSAPQRAVLPLERAVLPLERVVLPLIKRYYCFPSSGTAAQGGWDPERYYRGRRAVLPLGSGTTATTTTPSAAKPDTRKSALESRR